MIESKEELGIRIKWMGCACFELDFGNVTVVNDPWITRNKATELTWEAIEKCDYITLTHGHFDHTLDIPALLEKFGPYVLCGEFTSVPLLKWSNVNPMRIYPMSPDLELDFSDVKIKALYGRHVPLPGSADERVQRTANNPMYQNDPKLIELGFWGDLEYRNFLYTTPKGTKILIWGNKLRPEQCNILRREKPDIAILQVTEINSVAETAELMKEIGCKIVMPHHFDFPKDRSEKVKELKEEFAKRAPEIRYIIPQYGQWIKL